MRISITTILLITACAVAVASRAMAAPAEAPISRENIEWCDIWISNADKNDLPRVLLIGDSITRAYYPEVERKLAGKAYVARLATSRFVADPVLLGEVALVLDNMKFDVIQFNNGMHGWQHSEDEYGKAFPAFLETIQKHAPGAKLILATTTPVRKSHQVDQVDPRTDRVKVRNTIATGLAAKENIPVIDLFSLVEQHPEYYSADGVHFNGAGTAAQSEPIAAQIEKLLPH